MEESLGDRTGIAAAGLPFPLQCLHCRYPSVACIFHLFSDGYLLLYLGGIDDQPATRAQPTMHLCYELLGSPDIQGDEVEVFLLERGDVSMLCRDDVLHAAPPDVSLYCFMEIISLLIRGHLSLPPDHVAEEECQKP